jgi:hypothetical protein
MLRKRSKLVTKKLNIILVIYLNTLPHLKMEQLYQLYLKANEPECTNLLNEHFTPIKFHNKSISLTRKCNTLLMSLSNPKLWETIYEDNWKQNELSFEVPEYLTQKVIINVINRMHKGGLLTEYSFHTLDGLRSLMWMKFWTENNISVTCDWKNYRHDHTRRREYGDYMDSASCIKSKNTGIMCSLNVYHVYLIRTL